MIYPPQVRPEEPIAVTPHDGICGGESQQWLSYPTNPHVRFYERDGKRGVAAWPKPPRPSSTLQVKGRKRQVMVDTDGRGLILEPQPADVQDRDGAVAAPRLSGARSPSWPKRLRMLATPATNRPRRRSSPSRSCASRLTRSALPSTRGGGWSNGSSRGSAETGASGRILRQRSPRQEPSSTPLPS